MGSNEIQCYEVYERNPGERVHSGGSRWGNADPRWQCHEPTEHVSISFCGTIPQPSTELGEKSVTDWWSLGGEKNVSTVALIIGILNVLKYKNVFGIIWKMCYTELCISLKLSLALLGKLKMS